MSRPESFLLRMHRATVAAAGCMGSCKKHRALQAIVSGSVTLARGSVFCQMMSPRLLRFGLLATVLRACSIFSFRRIARASCSSPEILQAVSAASMELEWHVPEHTEIILLAAQV